MPWIDKERCVGCGTCAEQCPAGAITMEGGTAVLTLDDCIRCAICHDVCPVDAVGHDSDLTEREVAARVEETLRHARGCVRIRENGEDGWGSVKRHFKHYRRQKLVAEKILQRLEQILAAGDEKWMEELPGENE